MARRIGGAFAVSFEGLPTKDFEGKPIDARGLDSVELAAMEASAKESIFFSTKISDAKLLSEMQDYIAKAARGESGFHREHFLAKMRSFLGVEEGLSKRMDDITSAQRLRLIYDFHTTRISALKQYERDKKNADIFPAREFFRIESRKIHRKWRERWIKAGGKFYNGRMIAPTLSPIWEKLSAFGVPYAPFDFNSGMGTNALMKPEAVELGVVSEKEEEKPDEKPFDLDFSAGETQELPVLETRLPILAREEPKTAKGAELREKALKRANINVQNEIAIRQATVSQLNKRFGDKIAYYPNGKKVSAVYVGEVGERAKKAHDKGERTGAASVSIDEVTPQNVSFPKGSRNAQKLLDVVEDFLFTMAQSVDSMKISALIVSKPQAVKHNKETGEFAFGRRFRGRFKWVKGVADVAKKALVFRLLMGA